MAGRPAAAAMIGQYSVWKLDTGTVSLTHVTFGVYMLQHAHMQYADRSLWPLSPVRQDAVCDKGKKRDISNDYDYVKIISRSRGEKLNSNILVDIVLFLALVVNDQRFIFRN